MNAISGRRPSAALIATAIALVLALAGTALAGPSPKAAVTKAQAKSIAKKVAKKQIKQAAPGLSVAKAVNAQHAVDAQTATKAQSAAQADKAADSETVNGVSITKIDYRADAQVNPTAVTVFHGSGLKIDATCANPNQEIDLEATSEKPDASIYATAADTDLDTVHNDDLESGFFNKGGNMNPTFSLLAGADGDPSLITFTYDVGDGSVVSGTITSDETATGCAATGHVTSSSPQPAI